MFNLLPSYLRNISSDKFNDFKSKLDSFLKNVPDEPTNPDEVRVADTNGLLPPTTFSKLQQIRKSKSCKSEHICVKIQIKD